MSARMVDYDCSDTAAAEGPAVEKRVSCASSAATELSRVVSVMDSTCSLATAETATTLLHPYCKTDAGLDFLQIMDPEPSRPPHYQDAVQQMNLRYPTFNDVPACSAHDVPPEYTPAVERLAFAEMRLEKLSPYEVNEHRCWKPVILEINSTQLNVYHMSEALMKCIADELDPVPLSKATDTGDNRFIAFKWRERILNSNPKRPHTKLNTETLNMLSPETKSRILTDFNLYRSYTLQHARYGMPIDCRDSMYALRMRCESNQFIIKFTDVDDLIMWSMYISIGISVALDLDERQLPDYRIVPRRYRRRIPHYSSNRAHAVQSTKASSTFAEPKASRKSSTNCSQFETRHSSTSYESTTSIYSSHGYHRSRSGSSPLSSHVIQGNDSVTVNTPSGVNSSSSLGINMSSSGGRKLDSTQAYESNSLKSIIRGMFKSSGTLKQNLVTERKYGNLITKSVTCDESNRLTNSENSLFCHSSLTGSQDMSFMDTFEGFDSAFTSFEELTGTGVGKVSACSVDVYEPNITSTNNTPVGIGLTTLCNEKEDTRALDNSSTQQHRSEASICSTYGVTEVETDEEVDEDDDEYDEEDDDDGEDEEISPSCTYRSALPDDIFARHNFLVMDSKVTGGSHILGDSGDCKWKPEPKKISRRRYVRDSLRCIKPFPENAEWLGNRVLLPCNRPKLPPKSSSSGSRLCKIPSYSTGKFGTLIGSNYDMEQSMIKNHYLSVFIAEAGGYRKAA